MDIDEIQQTVSELIKYRRFPRQFYGRPQLLYIMGVKGCADTLEMETSANRPITEEALGQLIFCLIAFCELNNIALKQTLLEVQANLVEQLNNAPKSDFDLSLLQKRISEVKD